MNFPKHIPPQHELAVVELLKCFLKIKKAPKPQVRLHPQDLTRLQAPYTPNWRKVYHWIDAEKIYAKH